LSEVKVGDLAPDFSLPNQDGQMVRLSDYVGKSPVILFFYPKDFSGNCTREVCAFRDNYDVFRKMGAEVIGISQGNVESHQNFSSQYYLPYILLADEDGAVRNAWGVPKAFGLITGRVTYILDLKGIVRSRYESQININGHIQEALNTLKKIAKD
jgi:peroxiredoxin Q/BCP